MTQDTRGRGRLRLAVVLLIVLLALSQRIVSTQYWLIMPGVALPLDKAVSVEGKAFKSSGEFYLTAIQSEPATLWGAVRALVDPTVDMIPATSQIPANMTFEEYDDLMNRLMEESQAVAAAVALTHAGYQAAVRSRVKVEQFLEDSPAESVLKIGDVIVAVDGEEVDTAEQTVKLIQAREIGDPVHLTVSRDRSTIEADVVTTFLRDEDVKKKPAIGALIGPTIERSFPFDVKISAGDIGGSSGGLMFALAVRDRLDPEDLTSGKRIAGTGTLDLAGEVGPIGGVKQKVAAAEAKGAEIFFCPELNYEDAKKAARSAKVVMVKTFAEAYDYLKGLSQ